MKASDLQILLTSVIMKVFLAKHVLGTCFYFVFIKKKKKILVFKDKKKKKMKHFLTSG